MNEDGIDRDHVDDLAKRVDEKVARGEDPDDAATRVEWEGLTTAEKEDFLALSKQQLAQRKEKREALETEPSGPPGDLAHVPGGGGDGGAENDPGTGAGERKRSKNSMDLIDRTDPPRLEVVRPIPRPDLAYGAAR